MDKNNVILELRDNLSLVITDLDIIQMLLSSRRNVCRVQSETGIDEDEIVEFCADLIRDVISSLKRDDKILSEQ